MLRKWFVLKGERVPFGDFRREIESGIRLSGASLWALDSGSIFHRHFSLKPICIHHLGKANNIGFDTD